MKDGPSKHGEKIPGCPTVTIVGAGVSDLCAGYELKKLGSRSPSLRLLHESADESRPFREPNFAHGTHGEGGAMRILANHYLLHKHIEDFGLKPQLFEIEMKNKFIYISGYGEALTYDRFNELLQERDPKLLSLFPGLRECEKGKTCDKLFTEAVGKVVDDFWEAYEKAADEVSFPEKIQVQAIKDACAATTNKYDSYTLRSYLTDVAKWTEDAINLYDLGNAHVVFENGFIESFKDAFLSSNKGGKQAGMKQLQEGMDAVPNAFASSERGETNSLKKSITSDYLILAIPCTAQRTIAKSKPFVPMQEMAVRDVRYVEVTKILLQYKKRWWEEVFTKAGQGLDGGLVSDLPIRYTMFPKTDGNT
ncbi:hypothetical protein LZL87_008655 [Fusarium oxysporum]|nr:hypothetical protein LZL87_008655 [Fusarium oxysporum]